MPSIVQLYARSAFRVRAVFDGDPSAVQVSDFAITRQDGGPTTAEVASLFAVDGNSLELKLSERLISKVHYVFAYAAQSIAVTYFPAAKFDPVVAPVNEDPDAEANGVDLAWISDDPGPDGDCRRRKGLACVQYDLVNRAMLVPGELVQDQSAGASMPQKINGSGGRFELLQIAGTLDREWRRDDRVDDVSVDPVVGTDGEVDFNGQVRTRAGQSAPVRTT